MLIDTVSNIDITQIIYCFGSNQRGIHGKGSALTAATFFGAKKGQGEGISERSYAIPTKDQNLKSLSLNQIQHHIERFLDTSELFSDMHFFVTKVGCGLAGYEEPQIIKLFDELYPKYERSFISNVTLPTSWQIELGLIPKERYIIVAGSRTVDDRAYIERVLEVHNIKGTIISGNARGVDTVAIQWAKASGYKTISVPAPWEFYKGDKRLGRMRNWIMANIATDCIVIWNGESPGSKHMHSIALESNLDTQMHRVLFTGKL